VFSFSFCSKMNNNSSFCHYCVVFFKKRKNKDIALVVFSLHDDFLCLLNIKFVVQEKDRRQRVPFLEEESNNCKYLCPRLLWIDEIPLRMCLAKFTKHNSFKFQDVNKPKNCPIIQVTNVRLCTSFLSLKMNEVKILLD